MSPTRPWWWSSCRMVKVIPTGGVFFGGLIEFRLYNGFLWASRAKSFLILEASWEKASFQVFSVFFFNFFLLCLPTAGRRHRTWLSSLRPNTCPSVNYGKEIIWKGVREDHNFSMLIWKVFLSSPPDINMMAWIMQSFIWRMNWLLDFSKERHWREISRMRTFEAVDRWGARGLLTIENVLL